MKSFLNTFIFVGMTLCSLSATSTFAADDNKAATVRGGRLSIVGETNQPKLLLNGKTLLEPEAFGLDIVKTFPVGETDVVLVMNNSGGSACPVQYFFVTVTLQGTAKLSPEFGTCSDLAKPTQNGLSINVTMPKMTGRNNAKYIYLNGTLTENGKLIKDLAGLVPNDGEISINGRGQVLVSGNPDKRVLKCVHDYVEKERSYSAGWDDQIILKCNKSKKP